MDDTAPTRVPSNGKVTLKIEIVNQGEGAAGPPIVVKEAITSLIDLLSCEVKANPEPDVTVFSVGSPNFLLLEWTTLTLPPKGSIVVTITCQGQPGAEVNKFADVDPIEDPINEPQGKVREKDETNNVDTDNGDNPAISGPAETTAVPVGLKVKGKEADIKDFRKLLRDCLRNSQTIKDLVKKIKDLPGNKMVVLFVGRDIARVLLDAFRRVPKNDLKLDELKSGNSGTGTIDLADFDKLPTPQERKNGRTAKNETIPKWAGDRCQNLAHVLGEYVKSAENMKANLAQDYNDSHPNGGIKGEKDYRKEQKLSQNTTVSVSGNLVQSYGEGSETWELDGARVKKIRYKDKTGKVVGEKDPVFVGKVLALGPEPGYLTGKIPAFQAVTFEVQQVLEGTGISPGDTIQVLHLLLPGAPGNLGSEAKLDPTLFKLGNVLQERVLGQSDPITGGTIWEAVEVGAPSPGRTDVSLLRDISRCIQRPTGEGLAITVKLLRNERGGATGDVAIADVQPAAGSDWGDFQPIRGAGQTVRDGGVGVIVARGTCAGDPLALDITFDDGSVLTAGLDAAAEPALPEGLAVQAAGNLLQVWAGAGVRRVEARVYNLAGRKMLEVEAAGPRLMTLLHDAQGRPLANGVYLVELKAERADGTVTRELRKIVLMR